MFYIYLNEYPNGYLYVGSHSWNGEGLDPSYQGSSHIAKLYHWKPSKITILQTYTDKSISLEKQWIENYCNKFGVSPLVKKYANNDWVSRFKEGLMLNCHSNDASHLQTEENYKKAHKTAIENGSFDRFVSRSHTAESQRKSAQFVRNKEVQTRRMRSMKESGGYVRWQKASHTAESARKGVETRKLNGTFYSGVTKGLSQANTAENIAKRVKTHNYSESIKKTNLNRTGRVTRIVSVNGIVGTVTFVCESLGHKNWAIRVNQLFKKGLNNFSLHGYIWSLIEERGKNVVKEVESK